MLQSEKQRQKAKENVKRAWEEGDIVGLLRAGFDNFMNLIGNDTPLPFQKFLDYTGMSFDRYILETTQKEHVSFVGGKMVLEILPDNGNGAVPVQLFADFYFQTPDKKWVMKKKNGKIGSDHFTDWATDPKAIQLQTNGKMELSIEPPAGGSR